MTNETPPPWGMGTAAVWAGETDPDWGPSTVVPLFHGVTFGYTDPDEWLAVAEGRRPGHVYSRNTNPTLRPLEEKMRLLDGAEAATSFATGMAAISNTLFALLAPGHRAVAVTHTYGGTNRLFLEFLPRMGVECIVCETDDVAVENAVASGCRVLYLETPTNPTLRILDIARLAAAARSAGAITVVDNTIATPINQQPLALGADLVVSSATKFLGGHSDALGGMVTGRRDLVETIFRFREITGATLSAASAYQLLRGLKTLELRVIRHNQNAQAVAEFLSAHPFVSRVFYPGLPDHPGHAVARRQMRGFGGVLSLSLPGDFETVKTFLRHLRLAHRAASLGSVATLAGPPRVTSHVEVSEEDRKALGIPETLIRYAVGIENADDLIRDLDAALAASRGRT